MANPTGQPRSQKRRFMEKLFPSTPPTPALNLTGNKKIDPLSDSVNGESSLDIRLGLVGSSNHPLFEYLPENQKETIRAEENKAANKENGIRDARLAIVDINWRLNAEAEGKEIAEKCAEKFASSEVNEIEGLAGYDTYQKTLNVACDLLDQNVQDYVDRVATLMIIENPTLITDERWKNIIRKHIKEEYYRSGYYQDALAQRDGIIRSAEQIYLNRNPNYKIAPYKN